MFFIYLDRLGLFLCRNPNELNLSLSRLLSKRGSWWQLNWRWRNKICLQTWSQKYYRHIPSIIKVSQILWTYWRSIFSLFMLMYWMPIGQSVLKQVVRKNLLRFLGSHYQSSSIEHIMSVPLSNYFFSEVILHKYFHSISSCSYSCSCLCPPSLCHCPSLLFLIIYFRSWQTMAHRRGLACHLFL